MLNCDQTNAHQLHEDGDDDEDDDKNYDEEDGRRKPRPKLH